MYKNKAYKNHLKQNYLRQCEKTIINKLPHLSGKFTELKIWDDLNYAYQFGLTIDTICNRIIKKYQEKLTLDNQE